MHSHLLYENPQGQRRRERRREEEGGERPGEIDRDLVFKAVNRQDNIKTTTTTTNHETTNKSLKV